MSIVSYATRLYYEMKHLNEPIQEGKFVRQVKNYFGWVIQMAIYSSKVMIMEGPEEVLRQLQFQERNGQEVSQFQDKMRSREVDGNIRERCGSGLNVVGRKAE